MQFSAAGLGTETEMKVRLLALVFVRYSVLLCIQFCNLLPLSKCCYMLTVWLGLCGDWICQYRLLSLSEKHELCHIYKFKKNVCGGFAGGGFGGASMFEDLFGGFFGFPGMGGGGGGGRNRRRRGEDTFHPLRFVFLYNFQCTCYPPLSFFLYWKSENYWRQECVCVCATVFQHTSLSTIDLYCQFTCRELLTGTEIAGHGARSNYPKLHSHHQSD